MKEDTLLMSLQAIARWRDALHPVLSAEDAKQNERLETAQDDLYAEQERKQAQAAVELDNRPELDAAIPF